MEKTNIIKKIKENLYILYIIGTIIFILITFLAIKQTVMGKELKKRMDQILSVDQEEQKYIKNIKEELSKYGIKNAGVTMTKMVEAEGNFYYNIKIHHKILNEVEEKEREEILYSLKNIPNEIKNILTEHGILKDVYFIYEII